MMRDAAATIACWGGEEPKSGNEWSSKSGSRRVESRQRLVVGFLTSMGFLNHGTEWSLSFLSGRRAMPGSKPTGVMGVESRYANAVLSLVAGE